MGLRPSFRRAAGTPPGARGCRGRRWGAPGVQAASERGPRRSARSAGVRGPRGTRREFGGGCAGSTHQNDAAAARRGLVEQASGPWPPVGDRGAVQERRRRHRDPPVGDWGAVEERRRQHREPLARGPGRRRGMPVPARAACRRPGRRRGTPASGTGSHRPATERVEERRPTSPSLGAVPLIAQNPNATSRDIGNAARSCSSAAP